jgi:7-alpha-hydroxysteroid dehydrogenase
MRRSAQRLRRFYCADVASVMDLFRLDGGVAVVTGGGTGIGRAMALGLAEAGADIVVAGRRFAPLQAVVSEVEERGRRALTVPTDVTSSTALAELAERAASFGGVTTWVNCAGGLQGDPMGTVADSDEATWHSIMDRNLTSIFLAAKAAQTVLVDGGTIINVSSIGGLRNGAPGHGIYSAAKAAVNHLTQTLALECAPRHIRVNAIAPGPVATDDYYQASGFTEAQFSKLASKQPLGRLGCDDDFKAAAVFLASPASAWITGQVLVVSGAP